MIATVRALVTTLELSGPAIEHVVDVRPDHGRERRARMQPQTVLRGGQFRGGVRYWQPADSRIEDRIRHPPQAGRPGSLACRAAERRGASNAHSWSVTLLAWPPLRRTWFPWSSDFLVVSCQEQRSNRRVAQPLSAPSRRGSKVPFGLANQIELERASPIRVMRQLRAALTAARTSCRTKLRWLNRVSLSADLPLHMPGR